MYVEHSALDDADTGFYRILSDAAYCHFGQYAVIRLVCHLPDVLLPLGLHATVHLRHHDDRLTDINCLHPSFSYVQEVSFVRRRLAGGGAVGGTCLRNHVCFQLWRLLRLVEQSGHPQGQPFRSRYICVLLVAYVFHPSSVPPKMWTYRYLAPILVLVALVEMLLATEHVLEETFLEGVMHYGTMTGVQMDWSVLAGCLTGCLFSYWWMHVKHFNYLRLIIIGLAGVICYLLGYYFTVSSDIHISQLYLPMACRGFGYAVLSVTFLTCAEEIMSFQHFFQSLAVFQMLHMVMGGVIGAAIYTRGLKYYIPDNMARYGAAIDNVAANGMPVNISHFMEAFMSQMTEISIKQMYGWAAYACIFLFLLFLLYDAPIRRELKQIPSWQKIRKMLAESFTVKKKE